MSAGGGFFFRRQFAIDRSSSATFASWYLRTARKGTVSAANAVEHALGKDSGNSVSSEVGKERQCLRHEGSGNTRGKALS